MKDSYNFDRCPTCQGIGSVKKQYDSITMSGKIEDIDFVFYVDGFVVDDPTKLPKVTLNLNSSKPFKLYSCDVTTTSP